MKQPFQCIQQAVGRSFARFVSESFQRRVYQLVDDPLDGLFDGLNVEKTIGRICCGRAIISFQISMRACGNFKSLEYALPIPAFSVPSVFSCWILTRIIHRRDAEFAETCRIADVFRGYFGWSSNQLLVSASSASLR